MTISTNEKLAVLIDADNAQASNAEALLEEISRYGLATVKRAYGDWTTTQLCGWKAVLNQLAIQPVQQFSYTTGKNSTDAALIIDAMDLLYTAGLNGVCLVSSDSDFTRLATRLREAGLTVYGFGEKKTPQPFVAACDKFVYTEILKGSQQQKNSEASAVPLKSMICNAVTASEKDNGWSDLSAVGSMIAKNDPSFDPRNYGHQKLGQLIRNLGYLETKEVPNEGSTHLHLYVRLKVA